MALDLPSNPTDREEYIYTDPIGSVTKYIWIEESNGWFSQAESVPGPPGPPGPEGPANGDYLPLIGGDLTGDLTLGTDKITLDASDGSITAVDQINTPKVSLTGTGSSNGLIQVFGGAPANKDLVFDVYNGSNSPIQMFGDGSIIAAGSPTFSGSVAIGGPLAGVDGDTEGTFISTTGRVYATSKNSALPVWEGYIEGTSAPTSTILASGAATFEGDVVCANDKIKLVTSSTHGLIQVKNSSDTVNVNIIGSDGSGTFKGDVTAVKFIGDGSSLTGLSPSQLSLPDASLTQKGVVQLSNSASGTSDSLAGTESAVKTAYDRGSLGVANAASAQSSATAADGKANTAISDAATAQSTATNAASAASTAQARADKGVSDAATAQARADKGVSDAATAQARADKGVSDAATAQSAAVAAQSTANTAQSTATNAASAASTANSNAGAAQTTANAALPKAGGTVTGSLTVNGTLQAGHFNLSNLTELT